MKTLLFCLVLTTLISLGLCACKYRPGRRQITEFGRTRYLCDFPVGSNGSRFSITFELGSKFSTADCNECECTADGMRCCGFGINSGAPVFAPDGCHVVADGCNARVVYKSDNRTDCYAQNYGYNRRSMSPYARPFDPFMDAYGMFEMGGPGNAMGQRRGQANGGGEMESEGLLPILLPLLMGSFGEAAASAPVGRNSEANTMAGGAGPQTGGMVAMNQLPPLFRLMFLSSMFSS
ncbi:uncharacterized protein LOC132550068 [Ylistrum balloti]|uniref:uncharacterized protein LOC132550068 n=1 Tax=Ylistrum balloti TaxID=509963 RepID=UPI002905A94B|nr:uncharacterized protein LOC132550068 [Ylistrum balloti]